jgi:hypothetical protein
MSAEMFSVVMGIGRTYFYRLLAAYKLRPQTSTLLPGRDGFRNGIVGSQIHRRISRLKVNAAMKAEYV